MNAWVEKTGENRGSLLWHLACKDLKYARIWLMVAWLLAVLPLLLVMSDSEGVGAAPGSRIESLVAVSLVLGMAGGVLAAVRLFQLDSAPFLENPSSFISARPVSWRALIGAKMLILFSTLILPICIAHLGFLALFRLPLSIGDYILVALGHLLYVSCVFFVALVPALWRRSLGGYVTIMALLGAIYFLGVIVLQSYAIYTIDGFAREQLAQSRRIVFQIALLAGAFGVLVLSSRSKKVVGSVTMATILLAAGLRIFWPWDFIQYWRNTGPIAPPSEWPDGDKSKIEWRKWGRGEQLQFSEIGLPGGSHQYVNGLIAVQGVPESWYLSQRSYSSYLTLKTGKELPQIRRDVPSAGLPLFPALLEVRTGHSFERISPVSVSLFEYAPSSVAKAPNDALLRGSSEMEFRRAFILNELPLQEGASFHYGRKRFTLRDVGRKEGGIAFKLVEEEPHDRFRGLSWMTYPRLEPVLVNDARREAVSMSGTAMLTQRYIAATYSHTSRTFRFEPQLARYANFKAFSDDWKDGAKVLFITSERGGEIALPFQFDIPALPL